MTACQDTSDAPCCNKGLLVLGRGAGGDPVRASLAEVLLDWFSLRTHPVKLSSLSSSGLQLHERGPGLASTASDGRVHCAGRDEHCLTGPLLKNGTHALRVTVHCSAMAVPQHLRPNPDVLACYYLHGIHSKKYLMITCRYIRCAQCPSALPVHTKHQRFSLTVVTLRDQR